MQQRIMLISTTLHRVHGTGRNGCIEHKTNRHNKSPVKVVCHDRSTLTRTDMYGSWTTQTSKKQNGTESEDKDEEMRAEGAGRSADLMLRLHT